MAQEARGAAGEDADGEVHRGCGFGGAVWEEEGVVAVEDGFCFGVDGTGDGEDGGGDVGTGFGSCGEVRTCLSCCVVGEGRCREVTIDSRLNEGNGDTRKQLSSFES